MNKSDIRRKMHIKINALSVQQVQEKSEKIFKNLCSLPIYKNSNTIMSYVSVGNEVNTHPLIIESLKKGKRIFVPVCKPDTRELLLSELIDFHQDLERGYYNLLEPKRDCFRPVDAGALDIILMPGLAFTKGGYRLGHGAGYYDRFLSSLPKYIPTIALAFELQLIHDLPMDPHDVPIDWIVTEDKFISCKKEK